MGDIFDQIHSGEGSSGGDVFDQIHAQEKNGGPGQRFTTEEVKAKFAPLLAQRTPGEFSWPEVGKGALDTVKGAYHALAPPPDPNHLTRDNAIDSIYPLARPIMNMVGAHIDQAKKAVSVPKGKYSDLIGTGHALAAITPGGPWAVDIGETAPENPGRALGMAGAGAAMAEAPRIVPPVARAVTRGAETASKTVKGAMEAGAEAVKQNPWPITATEMMGQSVGHPLIGGAVGTAIVAAPEAIRGGVRAYRDATAPPTTPVEIGYSTRNPGRPSRAPAMDNGRRGTDWGGPAPPNTPPPAVEPIQAPLPSGRKIGPAPPALGPPTPPNVVRASAQNPGGRNSAMRRPAPAPEVVDAEAGPPAPPSALPAQGPPAPKQDFAFEGGETAPAGKPTKESVIKGHQTVRAKALARKLKIEGRDIDKLPPLGDPKWEGIAKSAGTTVPSSPESYQMVIDEYKKLPPGGDMPEFARGGLVTPKNQKLRTSRRGNLFGPPQLLRQIRAESGPPQPTS